MKLIGIIFIIFSLYSLNQNIQSNENNISKINNVYLGENISTNNILPTTDETINNNKTLVKSTEIASSWLLKDGWFPEQDLSFIRTDKETDEMVFNFRKDGTVEYLNKDFGSCPVGVFTMKDGKWTKDGQKLTLELRGLKISDYWYWWIIQYNIKELTTDKLKLEVVKVIKKKQIEPTRTWEDLIKE